MGKLLTARNIAEEFGETSRHWTKLAAAGTVPGARRPKDRDTWLFDLDVFRAWHEAGQPARPAAPAAPPPVRIKPGAPTPRQLRRKAEMDAEIDSLVKGALGLPVGRKS